jgi:hypothetical protein
MRVVLTAIAGALLLSATGVIAAPQIRPADCPTINAWAAKVNPNDTYPVAPHFAFPKAFQDANLAPVFGVPVLDWTPEDIQAASGALVKCYQDAGARRDNAAVTALANANRVLGTLAQPNAFMARARNDSNAAKQQVDALPDSSDLSNALAILLHANPGTPDPNAYRAIPHPVVDSVWRLAQAVANLADVDRAPLYQALGDRNVKIQASLSADANQAIAAATPDSAGVIAAMQAGQKAALISDPNARAQLMKSADDKAQQTRDALRQTKPAVWVPPACLDLYRWSSAFTGKISNLAGRAIANAFFDANEVPVFGIAVADWSDANIAQFKTLRGLCQSASQPAAAGTTPPPDVAQLVQTANGGRWIEAVTDQQMADARTTLATYRKVEQTMTDDLAKIAALPDVVTSLLPLAQIATDPIQNQLSDEERTRFTNAINGKRAQISTQSTANAIKGLDGVKIATLADFPKLFGYVCQTMKTIPDQQGQQTFAAAANKSFGDAATRLLPDFQSQLAALPATFDGSNQAKAAVAKVTGIPDANGARLPALKPYYDAALARSNAIVKSVQDQDCKDLLSKVGVGSDASQMVWDGEKGMTLGDFICGLATQGFQIRSYAGAGMFSSTSTLRVAEIKQADETISMHKVDIKPGTSMLVGFKILDQNGQQVSLLFAGPSVGDPKSDATLGIDGWVFYSKNATGMDPRAPEACQPMLKLPSPDQLPPDQKLFWIECRTGPDILRHPPS